MKFKVEKGTDSFNKLMIVLSKIKECRKAAKALVEELGFEKYYTDTPTKTDIAAFVPVNRQLPEHFKWSNGAVVPRKTKANKEIWERINSLPKVSHTELCDTIGYPHLVCGPGLSISQGFGVRINEDFILLDTSDHAEWTPPADVIEILNSEYIRLKATIESKEKEPNND